MTVIRWRSMSQELTEGATDGKYCKARPNTSAPRDGGATVGDKSTLHPGWGYATDDNPPVRYLPDGTKA